MLRLDWNLLFNIINLIILYALMKRFLFKPETQFWKNVSRKQTPDLYRPMRRRQQHRKKHRNTILCLRMRRMKRSASLHRQERKLPQSMAVS